MTGTNEPDPTAVLAVDLGKTGCRAAIWTHESSTQVTREGAGTPGLATPGGVDAAERVIRQTADTAMAASGVRQLRAVGIGAAGTAAAPEAAADLLERLRASLPAIELMLTSDAITSHAGALGGETGVVLAVGTGAVAIAIGPHGGFHQVDGWGPLLGDAGSGAWIGGAGLRAALRSFDGRGPATSLRTTAQQVFGDDLSRLPSVIGQGADAATTLASFAPAVAAAAASGDGPAGQIVTEAAAALVETVITAARHLRTSGQVPVAFTGGLLNVGPVLLERLQVALGSSDVPLAVRDAAGSSLDGARLLAVDNNTALEPLLHRALGRAAVVTS